MLQTKICKFTNSYSEIKSFQKSRTIMYSAEVIAEGIYLSISQKSGSDIYTEACVCSSASFEYITSFLKYICENSIGLGGWYDLLSDMDIEFTVE